MATITTTATDRVVNGNRLLEHVILDGLRSAFEASLDDEMTTFLRTITVEDHLELLRSVLLNGWAETHPTHLAFEAWRAGMQAARGRREALLAALASRPPTPAEARQLDDDIKQLAVDRAEAIHWLKTLGNARYPSVAAYLGDIANIDISRTHIDPGSMPVFSWR